MEITLTSITALACAVAYLIMARLAATRITESKMRGWLLGTLLIGALAGATFLLPQNQDIAGGLTGGGLQVLSMSLVMLLTAALTPIYLQRKGETVWVAAGAIWWVALAVLTFITEDALLGASGWFGETFNPVYLPGVVAIIGWLVVALLPLLLTFYAFYSARLAEVANRTIFWAITLPLALMGSILAASGSGGLIELGLILQAVGLMGVVYAAINLRVLDVRRNIWLALSAGVMTLLTILTVFVPLVIASNTDLDTRTEQIAFYALLATAAGIVYVAIRGAMWALLARFRGDQQDDIASRLHDFAEAISGVVELEELIKVTLEKLKDILRVQRGGLIFVNEDKESGASTQSITRFKLQTAALTSNDTPQAPGSLTIASPILKRLFLERQPLLQFDIDYNPKFTGVAPEEKEFFTSLRMAAYAPIIAQGAVIGVLATGSKLNDEAFLPQDLELLSTLANQAGVALRNAKLVDDLRRREQEASEANIALNAAKEQLEQLDAVKTDFITIASHELRTPLAQIRGYTDIIEALNEQGMLDPEQLSGMTSNLRKATDRMEELIRNMLDVSQLDVNAMDLRFAKITVENVVRLAIEPLTESIRNRKQSLTARGLRGLPEIEADMQRLVQAFQNVVLNAVKFTPDGGRIDITGSLQTNPKTKFEEIVVAISDTGIGIDKKNQEIIFEKFVRAHDPSLHSTGKTKFMGAGPGLGLTIARGVIDGHGGRIWVESPGFDAEKLPGSIFYIVLPVKRPDTATGVLHFEPTVLSADRVKLMEEVKAIQDKQTAK